MVGFNSIAQTNVIIGAGANSFTSSNGATGDCGPIYRSAAASAFDYSIHHHLFTAAELSSIPSGSVITNIAWFLNNGAATTGNAQKFNIYMNNSGLTNLPAPPQTLATLTASSTLVYASASQAIPATTGWVDIQLATPFTYNGGSLEVTMDWDISNVAGSPTTNGFAWKSDPYTGKVLSYVNSIAGTTLNNARTVRAQTRFTYIGGSPCSGTPNPGNTIVSSNPACPGSSVTFSLQNPISGSGVLFQWFNNNGLILGATNSSYTQIMTVADDVYCEVTCPGNPTASSSILNVTMNSFFNCYCIPTTTNGCASGDHITNVSFLALVNPINNNTGACLTASYSDYKTLSPTAVVADATSVPISVSVNNGGTEYAGAWIDYDQSGSFSASEFIALTDADGIAPWVYTGTAVIPSGIPLGNTVLRVRSSFASTIAATSACDVYSYGETEDYLINVIANTACTGTPTPGNTLANVTSVCPNGTVNLSLQNATLGSGVTYQWFENSLSPVLIAGATNSTYTATITIPAEYFCVVTCGSNTGSSTPIIISVTPFLNCYCSSSASFAADEEILNVTVASMSNSSTCLTTGGPGSTLSLYSDYTTLVSAPIVSQFQTVPFSIQVGTCGGNFSSGCAIFIDYNHDGSFDPSTERVFSSTALINGPYTITDNFIVPGTALTGITRMRVLNIEQTLLPVPSACGTYGYGETEDYLIDIIQAAPCAGTPTPGNTLANVSSVCLNGTVNLSLQNPPTGTGITYQWFTGNPPGTPILGATNSTYTSGSLTAAETFYCDVTCASSTANSTPITITINPAIGSSLTNPIVVGQVPCVSAYTNTQINTATNCFVNNNVSPTNQSSPDIYYQFTLANAATVNIGHCGSAFDTYIHLLDNAGVELAFNDDNGPLCGGTQSSIIQSLPAGTYYVVSEGFSTNTGSIITSIIADPINTSNTTTVNVPCGMSYLWVSPGDGNTYSVSGVYTYTVANTNCGVDSQILNLVVAPCSDTLNLRCFIECYMDGANTMRPVLLNQGIGNSLTDCDNITVEIYDNNKVFIATANPMLDIFGNAVCVFTPALNITTQTYYIKVMHRTTIDTWSVPITYTPGVTLNYDFSIAATQAFGANQVQVSSSPNVFAMYSGDIVKDCNIDLLDNSSLELAAQLFLFGYFPEDLNGDGNVDLLDFPCLEFNINAFIFCQEP